MSQDQEGVRIVPALHLLEQAKQVTPEVSRRCLELIEAAHGKLPDEMSIGELLEFVHQADDQLNQSEIEQELEAQGQRFTSDPD